MYQTKEIEGLSFKLRKYFVFTKYPTVKYLVKVLVALSCFVYILAKINSDWNVITSVQTEQTYLYGIACLLLSFVNWGLESGKWMYLVNEGASFERFLKSFKSVCAGVSTSIFMPNRSGDFIGRMVGYGYKSKKEIVYLSVVSGIAQLVCTILFGGIGLYLLVQDYSIVADWNFLLVGFGLTMLVFGTIVGWKRKEIKHKLVLWGFTSTVKVNAITSVIFLSLFRYIVFIIQYFLIMKLVGIDISFYTAFVFTSVLFFVMAIVPTFFLSEIGVKGAVMIYLFSLIGIPAINCMGASVFIWILNLALPALLGSWFIVKPKAIVAA